jgi:hypothetical protein
MRNKREILETREARKGWVGVLKGLKEEVGRVCGMAVPRRRRAESCIKHTGSKADGRTKAAPYVL